MPYAKCRGTKKNGEPCNQTKFLTDDGYCRQHIPALVALDAAEERAEAEAVFPVATEPADITLADYTNGIVRKEVTVKLNGDVDVTYYYKGKRYGGCLQWWSLRTTSNNVPIGKEEKYTLFPTAADRDANRLKVAEYSSNVERTLQAKRMNDLSHPIPALAPAGWR